MIIRPFCSADIAPFLTLAAAENWLAESWEFELLLSQFPQGCFAALVDDGQTVGFVTSLQHGSSGWIGNLVVSAGYRGQGIGEGLFVSALEALRAAGVDTVWLTASKSGLPLYEKHGFGRMDTIVRWVGSGRQRHAAHDRRSAGESSDYTDSKSKMISRRRELRCRGVLISTLRHRRRANADSALIWNWNNSVSGIDCQVWGDRRDALLAATVERGDLLLQQAGFLVVQPCGDALQFGPFSTLDDDSADALLNAALHTIPLGTAVCLDAPASNRAALRLFNRRRMRIAGSSELMFAGVRPEYRPDMLYGLATMGSCG